MRAGNCEDVRGPCSRSVLHDYVDFKPGQNSIWAHDGRIEIPKDGAIPSPTRPYPPPPSCAPTPSLQKRDLTQVGSKLQVVLLPRENQDGVLKKLKDCTCRREK